MRSSVVAASLLALTLLASPAFAGDEATPSPQAEADEGPDWEAIARDVLPALVTIDRPAASGSGVLVEPAGRVLTTVDVVDDMLRYRVRSEGGAVDADFHSAGPAEALLTLREPLPGASTVALAEGRLIDLVGSTVLVIDPDGDWQLRQVVAASPDALTLTRGPLPQHPGAAVIDSEGRLVALLRSSRQAIGLAWLRDFEPDEAARKRRPNVRATTQLELRLGVVPLADFVNWFAVGGAIEQGLTVERRLSLAVGVEGLVGSKGTTTSGNARTTGALYGRLGPRIPSKQGSRPWLDLSVHPHALAGLRLSHDVVTLGPIQTRTHRAGLLVGGGLHFTYLGLLVGLDAVVDPTDPEESFSVRLTVGTRLLWARDPADN